MRKNNVQQEEVRRRGMKRGLLFPCPLLLVLAVLVLLLLGGEESQAKPVLPGGELQILDDQGQK
ncbi:MAG: hypothetical protein D6736_05885, partial [Nitrospinota bacterium]